MNRNLIDNFEKLTQKPENIAELKKLVLQLAVQGKLTEEWRITNYELGITETGADLLEKVKAEKQALIKAGKLKPQKPLPEIEENEIPFEVPDTWVWTRLGEIIYTFSTGPFGTMLHKQDYVQGGIPIVNPQHMVQGKIIPDFSKSITKEKFKELINYKLNEGDIVIARRGELGRLAIVSKNEDGFLCGTGSFFVTLNRLFPRQYFYILFSSFFIRELLVGLSKGSTMDNLNQTILLNLLIPLPPLAEQKAIVEKVESLFAKIDSLHALAVQRKELSQQTAETLLKKLNATNDNLQAVWQLLQQNFGKLITM